MKICHFIASRGLGRGEFYIDLVNELSYSEDIYLIIPKNSKFMPRISKKIHIFKLNSSISRFNPFLLWEIIQIMKTLKPDIVHTHFAKATEIFYFINKLLHYSHVATKHNPRKAKIFNKIKHVTAVSKDVAKSIQHPNVKVIYNGITPVALSTTQDHPQLPFIISAVGRLDKIKGYDILIQECAKLDFDFRLQIVGAGNQYQTLQALITKCNLQEKVVLLGFKENIPEIMHSSDLVVISSHSEGFSLTMVEALFYTPILISTKVSGATEILTNDFLIEDFNISDKIKAIYQQYTLFEVYFQDIKNTFQKCFLLQEIANEYKIFYDLIREKKQ